MSVRIQHAIENSNLLVSGMEQAAQRGYSFIDGGLSDMALSGMTAEVKRLNLELGDHIAEPINPGTKKQITQMHERAYHPVDDISVPMATFVTDALVWNAKRLRYHYPALENWRPTEAGYQIYRDSSHHISKHTDRHTDKILAATITIFGTARVGIWKSEDSDNYEDAIQIDEHTTKPGTIMFLRAAGLGTGEQVIHDVSPPVGGSRLILNLRMRPNILPSPTELKAAG